MANDFHEVRFPIDISQVASSGPSFKTTIATLYSGSEQRNKNWARQRCIYDVGQGVRDLDRLQRTLAFFYNRNGMFYGFRFMDWLDYKIPRQIIGHTGGTTYQIKKTYTDDGNFTFDRVIFKIVQTGFRELAPRVWVNNTLKTYTTDYTIAWNTGVLTLVSDPGAVNVEFEGEFDVPVRFNIDQLEINMQLWFAGAVPKIPIIELKVVPVA